MENIPSKTTSPRFNQPWINQQCKRLSRRKKRLYKRARRTNFQTDWDKFKTITSQCKRACRKAHDKYINEKVIDSGNPKRFYSYIKSKQQDNIAVAPLKKGDKLVIDDSQKANILNDQYCSVFSKRTVDSPFINCHQNFPDMPDFEIKKEGINALLNRLQPHNIL